MDAFYAAVETLSNPLLKGKPMAVGSMSMISTANYEARRFGVRAAMPGFIARKLCPELIFVPIDFNKYTYYSDLTRKVFQKYDPNFMATSLDEAYLDITRVCKERGITGGEVAEELRASVFEDTGLTCSAGVAANQLLAKVCSDINKPNGQFVLPNDRAAVMTFISSLPIRKIGGIGKVTEHILKDAFGITTCEEMLQKCSFLCALFSRSSADFFLSVALGIGRTDTPQVQLRKSISNERTFSATADEVLLYQKLVELTDLLCADMKKEGLCGRTLTLKLKTASFEVRTRAVTLAEFICSSEDILKHASKLLRAELPVSLRLMGLRMSHFNEEKYGAPSDPAQKTISNFFKLGNASGKNTDVSNNLLSGEKESDLPIYNNEIFDDCKDPVAYSSMSDHNHVSCYSYQMEKPTDESKGKVNDRSMVGHTLKPCETGITRVLENDSCNLSGQFEESRLDRPKKENNLSDNEAAGYLPNQEVSFLWLDGYKCSLCGVELPPSFVEERQEHSDFHIAERLQEEESGDRNYLLKQRVSRKQKEVVGSSHGGRKKKHKSSPADAKHIPIDAFFVKSSQNI